MSQTPTRFPGGVSTSFQGQNLGMLSWIDNIRTHIYFNDFDTYAAGDWTVTSTNSGTSALVAGNGGKLVLTTGGTATNYQGNALTTAGFYLTAGAQAWFQIAFAMSDTTDSYVIGMTAGGPSAPTDGIYFTKAASSTDVNLVVRGSSTSTTAAAVTTQQAAQMTLGFHYNGSNAIRVYSSYGLTASLNSPKFGGNLVYKQATLTNLPATTMGLVPQFYFVETGTGATTLTIDYVLCAVEVARF